VLLDEKGYFTNAPGSLTHQQAEQLRKKFQVNGFTVLLIGKDGREK
jgi:hypothetical protein